jgi:hypothetical protein
MSSNLLLTLKQQLLDVQLSNSLDKLKDKLEIATDELLIEYLLCLLKDEIENSKYYLIASDEVYIKRLYDLVKIFIAENRKIDTDYINKKIAHITKYIDLQLYELKQNKSLSLFKQFWLDIDKLNTRTKNIIKNRINEDNKNYSSKVNKYEILKEAVFTYKSIYMIKLLKENYVNIFLTQNNENKPFFSELVTRYIDALLDDNTSIKDIMNYETIINMFLEESKLTIENKIKELVVEKEKDYLKNKNHQSSRAIYFLHLRKKLYGEKKFVSNIDELNEKYNGNIHISNYNQSVLSGHLSFAFYEDMNSKNVITIDGNSPVDVDDGLSFERLDNGNYLLGVYITDLSRYIRHNSFYDVEALYRISSTYSGDKLVRQLISSDFITSNCSLLPGNSKKTLACFFEIDNDGNVLNYQFKRVAITIRDECHLSYGKVDSIIKKERNESEIDKALIELSSLMDKGVFKTLGVDTKDDASISHIMVSKPMLLINHISALEAKEKGVPFVFSACPSIDKTVSTSYPSLDNVIKALAKENNSDSLRKAIYNHMAKCYYTTKPIPHMAMNNNVYGTISSPLRRYVDLLNQRLFCLFNFDNKTVSDKQIYIIEEILNEIVKYLNENKAMPSKYGSDYAHILKK